MDVKFGAITDGANGIFFNSAGPTGGTVYTALDNKVTGTVVGRMTGNAIQVNGSQNSDIIQGNEFYINFVVSCQRAVLFYAANNTSPNWDSNKFVFQAIDAGGVSAATALGNISGSYISRAMFRCETWGGGIPSNGFWVTGLCYSCDIYIAYANDLANYSMWNMTGPGNRITISYTSDTNARYAAFGSSPSKGSFNGGTPISAAEFVVTITPPSAVAPGAALQMYFYSPYALSGTNIPEITGISQNGFIINNVSLTNVPNEVSFSILNVSSNNNAYASAWKVAFGR